MAPTFSALSAFLSLDALRSDQLTQLILGSISLRDKGIDRDEGVAKALDLCRQCEENLLTLLSATKNHDQCKPNTIMKVSNERTSISDISCDNILVICSYLDSKSKARLRLTSVGVYIDTMSCPLDLSDITIPIETIYEKKENEECESESDGNGDEVETNNPSPCGLIPLIKSCASMRVFKRANTTCGCDASRQLQLIDLGTAEVNEPLCSELTESQLLSIGVGRSWWISGICLKSYYTEREVTLIFQLLNKYNAGRPIKRLRIDIKCESDNYMFSTLLNHDIVRHVEDLVIDGNDFAREDFVSLDVLLPCFNNLRCIELNDIPIEGYLSQFVEHSPQLERLSINFTEISGDITCLASLKNLTKLELSAGDDFHGDIASLSSLIQLKELLLGANNITGNTSSLANLNQLESIYLSHTRIEGDTKSFIDRLPKLQKLTLHSNSNMKGELTLSDTISRLDISTSDLHFNFSSLMSLSNLVCCELQDLPNVKGDISAMSHLTNLETLHIIDMSNVEGDISVMSHLTKLETLCIQSLPNVEGGISVMSHLTKLETLSINSSPNVEGDISVMSHLTNLESLYIQSLPNVEGDISVISHLTNLKCLVIRECDQLVGSINSLNRLPVLNHVYISDIPQITGDVASLKQALGGSIGSNAKILRIFECASVAMSYF